MNYVHNLKSYDLLDSMDFQTRALQSANGEAIVQAADLGADAAKTHFVHISDLHCPYRGIGLLAVLYGPQSLISG